MDNRAETATDRWFKETATMMDGGNLPDTSVNNLLSSVIPLTHNYCKAAFLLANHGHRLPAMAILRVLGELALRVTWCMYEDNERRESAEDRIMRWMKITYIEEVRRLKKLLPLYSDERAQEIRNMTTVLESKIESIQQSDTGRFYTSMNELPKPYREKIHPLLYGSFNCAIHPDLRLFGALTRLKGNTRMFLSDLDVTVETLRIYCMTAAFNILAITRVHYKWDYEGMKVEYLGLKKELAGE